jgi:hypothetical protein
MRRRAPSLIALAGVVALMLAAAPAVALSPFGATVEVVESSCHGEDSTSDAVMGTDGILRGFVDFAGGNCPGTDAIRYFEKDGGDVTVEVSPYRGEVLSVTSDATGVYLLYQALNGSLYLTKRASGGVFTAGRRLSSVKEATSVVWGMPGAVARAGLARSLLPPEGLAEQILAVAGTRAGAAA